MQFDRTIDVLIITALGEEYEQVLAVNAGASSGSQWETRPGPLGHEVAFRSFASEHDGQPLEVAVTWATNMGGVATAGVTERLIGEYLPRCIAMCGVCAGRRGDVTIGDVIIADRVWMYDTGKLKVEYDAEGNRVERIQGDTLTYNLRSDWKKAAEGFTVPRETVAQWGKRPRPADMQANWILERIVHGEDPRKHADIRMKAPDYPNVIELLWKKRLLDDGTFNLTAGGKRHIDRLLLKHYDGLPEVGDFRVHVGPIGSGNRVIQDPQIFDRLSESMRKVIGLEMEAMAIGAVAHDHQDDMRHIVAKGVMDHADDWKNDSAKRFAARASAECLIAFLRKNLPPVERPAKTLFRKWDRVAATQCVFEQLHNFGGADEYELDLPESGSSEVAHELLDFYYLPYMAYVAYIAVAVTRTVPPAEAHVSMPSLSFVEFIETTHGWQLGTVHVNALHVGSWGNPPEKMHVMDIGYNMFAIAIEAGFMNQGQMARWTSLHTTVTDEFKEVFEVQTFADDWGFRECPNDQWSAEIKVVREGTSFYDLIVTRTGLRDGKKINERQLYRFDGRRYALADLYR